MSNLKLALSFWWHKLVLWARPLLRQALKPLRLQSVAGQAMVEYGLLIALIALAVIGILALLGPQVGSVFSGITTSITGCQDASGTTNANCTQPLNSYPTPIGG